MRKTVSGSVYTDAIRQPLARHSPSILFSPPQQKHIHSLEHAGAQHQGFTHHPLRAEL
jgi:hypothetical protein